MDIDLNRLRHIVAIARARSFSRAAHELHITQPALSRSLSTFEERFGFRLFDRGRAGVVPTAEGELVVAEAERLLRSARDLEHNLHLYRQGEAGKVTIGLGPLAASLILPKLSQTLMRERPRLRLETSIKSGEQLLQQLLDDDIEMIIANSWQMDTSREVIIAPVGTIRLGMIVRAGHPLAGSKGLRMTDLESFPAASAVQLPAGMLTGEAGGFVCDNFHILRDIVLNTDCVSLASPDLLAADIADGLLSQLDMADFVPLRRDLCMIRRNGRTMSPAAQAVANAVQEICATFGGDS